jgi:hypothetical protein
MVAKLFPDPQQQARAIGVFGIVGAIGNGAFHSRSPSISLFQRILVAPVVGGILIGAALVQFATWLMTLITIPLAIGCVFVIPAQQAPLPVKGEKTKLARLDMIGVSILTGTSHIPSSQESMNLLISLWTGVIVAIILFVFALTQGANSGWGEAGVIAPLIISVLLVVVFFIWEKLVDESIASLCV